jgi:hypothetical protein
LSNISVNIRIMFQRKKFRLLKIYLKLVRLNNLLKYNFSLNFHCIQYFNSLKYIVLKSILYSLGLLLTHCNSILFKKKICLSNSLTIDQNKFLSGNILAIYPKDRLSSSNKDRFLNFILDKTVALPLFFYLSGKFFYRPLYVKEFGDNVLKDLILMLQFSNSCVKSCINALTKSIFYLL